MLLAGAGALHAGPDPRVFLNPPPEARPKTWMHAMDGNLSEAGLKKDLQAIAKGGLGGALIFSVSHRIPDGRVKFNSPEFRSIILSGVKEADRLGLEIGVHNCDGWTSSGGPWVPVEESMKRVVWSECIVKGGGPDLQFAQPRTMHGYYRDIAVVAYPATAAEHEAFATTPKWSASSNHRDLPRLRDGSINTTATISNPEKGKRPWIQLSFDKPHTAGSIYLELLTKKTTATLLTSPDGTNWGKPTPLKGHRTGKRTFIFENNLNHLKARHFRIEFNQTVNLVHVDLDASRRLPAWQGQVSIVSTPDSRLPKTLGGGAVPMDQVLVLSRSADHDGRAKTRLPDGYWRVFRFGYTTTGATNSPATDSGRGFECDKLDAAAIDRHFAAYVGKLAKESGRLAGKAFRFSEIDSYEVGGQNWTGGFERMFKAAKGYDITPFLPLIAGRLVGDDTTMAAVLHDLRSFTCDLMTHNYYKRFTELCHQHGMVSYIENYGFGPVNSLSAGAFADIPMGEFWIDTRPATHYVSPISAAHTYGKPVISAESFTSDLTPNWGVHPFRLKSIGDHVWTRGINEFMFHRFAHQANTHVVPGMTMSQFGSHIDRTQTWWLNAGKSWMKYIQRGSWLLRQGVPVSDLLIYVGEGSPHLVARREIMSPRLPTSYNFDHCDTDFYFIHNKDLEPRTIKASFRISGRIPELWFPDTGKTEAIANFTQKNGRTEVPVAFDPHGSVFVIFRQPSKDFDPITNIAPAGVHATRNSKGILLETSRSGPAVVTFSSGRKEHLEFPALPAPATLAGPWTADFDGIGLKDPKTLSFPKLIDWKDHAREDIRHFSGSAVYAKEFKIPDTWKSTSTRTFLDLGKVEIAAEVNLNGEFLGVLWKPPFRIDVTDRLKPGQNELMIRVTNLWTNRLIGDEALQRTDGYRLHMRDMPDWYVENKPLPAGPRSTFSTYNFHEKDRKLAPSGLLGPVTLSQSHRIQLDE